MRLSGRLRAPAGVDVWLAEENVPRKGPSSPLPEEGNCSALASHWSPCVRSKGSLSLSGLAAHCASGVAREG